MLHILQMSGSDTEWLLGFINETGRKSLHYGVVPKGLLTFLGSLYKEVAKTTSGTLVYRFERQAARKKIFSSTYNEGFYLRNLQITAFCILMSYFRESKLKKVSIDSW